MQILQMNFSFAFFLFPFYFSSFSPDHDVHTTVDYWYVKELITVHWKENSVDASVQQYSVLVATAYSTVKANPADAEC